METIADSLIVHLSDETDDGKLLLFVVVNGGNLSHQIELDLRDALRSRLSPRHVPNKIIQVAGIPRTLSGKKLEIPVKKILLGSSPDEVCSRNSLVDPNALDEYVRIREALAIRPSGP
jgi:acetoacetyl-CoA synthetase